VKKKLKRREQWTEAIKWGFTAARSENCREQSIDWRIEIVHWRGWRAFERSKN